MAQDEVTYTRRDHSVWEEARVKDVRELAGYDQMQPVQQAAFDHYMRRLVTCVQDGQQVADTKKLYAWAEEFQREGEAGRLYAQAIRRAADKVGQNS